MEIMGKKPIDGMPRQLDGLGDIRSSERNATRPDPQKHTGDRVILSPGAREVQEAQRMIQTMTDDASTKVAALREQIDAGLYRLDTRKTAWRMLTEHLTPQK